MPPAHLAIHEEAQRAIHGINLIPSPSPILGRLLDALHDPYLDAEKFETLVNKDPALSAKILNIANSAYYGLSAQISTIERAIVVIGIDEVKNICLTVLLSAMFSRSKIHPAFDMGRFWKHSLFVALAVKDMAGKFNITEPETGYVLGLLHDVGRIASATYMHHFFEEVHRLATQKGLKMFQAEKEIGLTHAQIGSWLGKKWALPSLLCTGIKYHHEPEKAQDHIKETLLIHMADTLAYSRSPGSHAVLKEILQKLRISPDLSRELENCTVMWWENVKALWETLN